MLKSLKIKNFKPFAEFEAVRLAPITLVYGPNSSGKSSIIQSLLLLSQTINGQKSGSHNDLITRGSLVDLGNFSSILHRHDGRRSLNLEFEFDDAISSNVSSRTIRTIGRNPFAGLSLGYRALPISSKHILPMLQTIGFQVNDLQDEMFSFHLERQGGVNAEKMRLKFDREDDDLEDHDESGQLSTEERTRDNCFKFSPKTNLKRLAHFICEFEQIDAVNGSRSRVTASHGGFNPSDLAGAFEGMQFRRDYSRSFFGDFLPTSVYLEELRSSSAQSQALTSVLRAYDRNLRKSLGGISYLGPLRSHPARHYLLDGVPGQSVGTRGEHAVQILFHDIEANAGRSPLLERLNDFCRQFEIPYAFGLKNVGDAIAGDVIVLTLQDTRTGVRVGPADVGFGIGQLLPILIEGIVVNERNLNSRMVCVEQPEIHLHPRLQASLADFFIDTSAIRSRDGSRAGSRPRGGVQWLLETHSEALILRIQRRIREGRLSSRDVSVLYVEPRGDRGSAIQELRLDDAGDFIDLWPDGFFVESFSELMGGR